VRAIDRNAANRDLLAPGCSSCVWWLTRPGVEAGTIACSRRWFYPIAVAFVPVRRKAAPDAVREGVRLARAELRELDLSSCARHSRAAAAHGRVILLTGRLYPLLLRPALVVHDLLRRLRR